MAVPKNRPSIWAKSLSELLCGEHSCEWALWFMAHFAGYEQASDDGSGLARWKIEHAELVRTTRDSLEADGYTVHEEEQNRFTVSTPGYELVGKPDIIATRKDEALIVDCKTGKEKDSHVVQVMIYMWGVPIGHPAYRDVSFTGLLVYPEDRLRRTRPIDSIDDHDEIFVNALVAMLGRVGANAPARKVPSFSECQYCKIAKSSCPERVETKEANEGFLATDEFGEIRMDTYENLPPPLLIGPAIPFTNQTDLNPVRQAPLDSLESQLAATEHWCEELAAKLKAQEARIAALERHHIRSKISPE